MIYRTGLLLFASVFLFGCELTEPTSPSVQKVLPLSIHTIINHRLFTAQTVPNETEIFALSSEEQAKFLRYYARHQQLGTRADRIISGYLEDSLTKFKYDGKTLTASESLADMEGNCISLAILTEAYAHLAGIHTTFTEVSTVPIYEVQSGAILVANHFKTKLLAPEPTEEKGWNTFNKAGTIIDYFPVYDSVFIGNATKNDLLAKFYGNRSVDNMLAGDLNKSYSYLIEALSYVPNDPELLNIAALLHKRAGDMSTAKHLFQIGFSEKLDSYNLLSNYLTVLDSNTDKETIAAIESRIEDVATTPIDWLLLAKDAIHKGELSRAEALLNKVIDRVPYLPEPYIELAKINFQRGYTHKTQELLAVAKQKTRDKEKLALVEAKQAALKRLYLEE